MSAFVRSDTVRTRAAFRTARGTTRRKIVRSFQLMKSGSRANETSWTVTTNGHGQRSGAAYCVWTRSAPRRLSVRGSDQAIRSSCERGRELGGLDALRHEVGPARRRDEPDARLARERTELAEEVERVRLVARALASEDVRVEDDDLHASSLQSSTTASAARCQREPLRTCPPRDDELVPPGVRFPDAVGDRRDVERVDENRRATGDLLHRRPDGRHHRRPAGHRLEHGQPEALVQRRVEDAASAAVERRELRVRDLADPAVDLDTSPPACAHHAQLDPGLARRVDGALEVLSRLERRDREDVVAVRARAVRAEDGIDAVRDDANPLGGNPGQLDRLVATELGDRDDRVGRPQDADETGAAVEPVPAWEDLRRAEDREVVHREHRRHARGDGAAERRAVQDVERAGTAPEADRVPHGIARHARRSAGPAERQELEVEPRSVTERAEEPAHVPRRSRARLHERRGVDPDLHCSSRAAARTASFVAS